MKCRSHQHFCMQLLYGLLVAVCLNYCSHACELLGMAALNRWFGTAEMLLAEWFMCVSVCLLWFSGHKNERSGAGQPFPCSALSPLTFSLSPHAFLCMSFHPPSLIYYFHPSTLSIPVYWRNLKHAV